MSTISNIFIRLSKEFFSDKAKSAFVDSSLPVYDFVSKSPDIFYNLKFNNELIVNKNRYLVQGSLGQGNWTDLPWLAIFNKNITTSAQKGVYIVYLFSSDLKTVYITLNQGCTKLHKLLNTDITKQVLIQVSTKIRKKIKIKQNDFKIVSNKDDDFELNKTGLEGNENTILYKAGTIYYKKYDIDSLPNEDVLLSDLKTMMEFYDDYAGISDIISPDLVVNNLNIPKTDTLAPVLLYGPPGTGKTYTMQHHFIKNVPIENVFVTTFHQSFSYEDFVEGLKPKLNSESSSVEYEIVKGIFYQACDKACEIANCGSVQEAITNDDRKINMKQAIRDGKIVYLCIDEINRANISAVFGELISLIETSKRIGADNEMVVKLPYSKQYFSVPMNLYIIGTMNTADRSIQLLDSALRRRFKFIELMPNYDAIDNIIAREILMKMNARIRCLLDKDHQIGHSYFINKESPIEIFNVIKNNIIPLLEEYFYNDTTKIRQVLNEYYETTNTSSFYIPDIEANKEMKEIDPDMDLLFKLNPDLDTVFEDFSAETFLAHIYKTRNEE